MKKQPKKQHEHQTSEVPPVLPTPAVPPGSPHPAAPFHAEPPRRSFLYKAVTAVIGVVIGIVPLLAGLRFFFDPLTRKKAAGKDDFLKVTTLSALRGSSRPQLFPIRQDIQDAWNKFPNSPVGAVFIQYVSDTELRVFNSTCPHLGCAVDYKEAEAEKPEGSYWCPCHTSSFDLKGERLNHIPPRALDSLEYRIEPNGDVKVQFKKFLAGKEAKVEV